MDFLPILISIKNRNCLVIGGGKVAARKVALLLRAGARITVIAPELDIELHEQLCQGIIVHRAESFTPAHLDDATLVFAATNDRLVNQQISEAAGKLRIPINVADNPDLCSFIMPSIIDRSPILVAVSSSGKSPVLARILRAHLETMIPEAYGRLATYAANFREQVKQH
ncbi:MAG: bifunctional precorrin-2 dehydrogenase/sirohydrochlorin ferrochelatase, partial [Nitrosomonadaceae bacterium]